MPRYQGNPTTVMLRTSGLNTVLDPERLQQGNSKNGYEIELARAVNMSIDDRGLPELRQGSTSISAGSFSSSFCDGGDCFVVQERAGDAAIFQVTSLSPVTLTGVRSGLTKSRRMTWAQAGTDTFYSNGLQNGFIRAGVSSAWPAGTYTGPDADMQFEAAAPLADHIAFLAGGKVALAVGEAVYLNHAPFQYGLFNLRKGYIGFASPVQMLCPVRDGFFASDASTTWFFRQMDGWYQFKQERADEAPVFPGSLAIEKVLLRDAGIEQEGYGRVWTSSKGVCIGTDSGAVFNITEDKVLYPSGYTYGASLVYSRATVITTVY